MSDMILKAVFILSSAAALKNGTHVRLPANLQWPQYFLAM